MNAQYLRKVETVLIAASGPIRVVFRNAAPFTGELSDLARYVKQHNARFNRGSTHDGNEASYLPRFTPTNAAQRTFLAAKLDHPVEDGECLTFGSIEKANEFARSLGAAGISWNKERNFGWAIIEHRSEETAMG